MTDGIEARIQKQDDQTPCRRHQVTVIGTLDFMRLENPSFSDALYYNIVTMSTVGEICIQLCD
ncbi:MAG: two pore domain potassium channel family protein [Acidobacteria bacterium]|nr:two pore domain potassium channel family protein [Acidobacteriota bacterium]